MKTKRKFVRFAVLATLALAGTQFVVTDALAIKGSGHGGRGVAAVKKPPQVSGKRPHCAAIPVAGSPGTNIVICSTNRP